MMLLRFLPIVAALALLSGGCGKDGGFKIARVSGRVTLNGKPVEKIAVIFMPVPEPGKADAGPSSSGVTDADGRYTLKLIAKGEAQGAVVGKHKVRFNTAGEVWDPDVDPKPPPSKGVVLPARYTRLDKAQDYEVPAGGTGTADFALTSP